MLNTGDRMITHKYNIAFVTQTDKVAYANNPVEVWDIPGVIIDSEAIVGLIGIYVEPVEEQAPIRMNGIRRIESVPPVFDGTYDTTEEQRNQSTKNHEVDLSKRSNSGL